MCHVFGGQEVGLWRRQQQKEERVLPEELLRGVSPLLPLLPTLCPLPPACGSRLACQLVHNIRTVLDCSAAAMTPRLQHISSAVGCHIASCSALLGASHDTTTTTAARACAATASRHGAQLQ